MNAARILIVDDEETVLGLMAMVLRMAGYLVQTAPDGREALSQFRNGEGAPDLLVTDLLLQPDFPGHELARNMRIFQPGLPVLYVSGLAECDLVEEEVAQGQAAFLAKPFSPRMLRDWVKEALKVRNLAVT